MLCPHCGHMDDKVLESRQNSSGSTIRRRVSVLSVAIALPVTKELKKNL